MPARRKMLSYASTLACAWRSRRSRASRRRGLRAERRRRTTGGRSRRRRGPAASRGSLRRRARRARRARGRCTARGASRRWRGRSRRRSGAASEFMPVASAIVSARHPRERHGRERDEEAAEAHALDHDRADDVALAAVEREVAHLVRADREGDDADADEQARRHVVVEAADDRRRHHHDQHARHEREARLRRGEAEQLLHEERQEEHVRHQHREHEPADERPGGEDRILKRRRFTTGAVAVSSRTTKATSATSRRGSRRRSSASRTSRCARPPRGSTRASTGRPRAARSPPSRCGAARARRAAWFCRRMPSSSCTNEATMKRPTAPMGRLMKKIHDQCQWSTMTPPSVGPTAGPSMTTMPKRAIAIPCSCGGKVCRRMACSVGCSAPAPRPWRARYATSCGSVFAVPQRAEPARKSDEADHVDALLPEHAAEERRQRHEQHERHRVAGAHPGDLLDGRPERSLDVRQSHVHDRRVDRAHQRAEADRHGDEPLARGPAADLGTAQRRRDRFHGATIPTIPKRRRQGRKP